MSTSPFSLTPLTYKISLPPSSLSNIPLNLTLNLNKSLLTYDKRLNGILVSYKDMSFKNNLPYGKIINENPYINFTVSLTGLIFSPEVGSTLTCTINKISSGHVGVLIYGCFNGSCLKKELEGWEYEEEGWRKGERRVEEGEE
ncbi:hypothetical protein TrVE_jg1288, partial [Triparma verrucosa]